MGRRKPNKPRRERLAAGDLGEVRRLLGMPEGCQGLQLDHRDGSMSCSRGADCPGVALPHNGWTDCVAYGPCAYCAAL